MNVFDFILLVPVVYFLYKGVRQGFVKRVFAIAGLILGVIAASFYHYYFAELLSKYWQNDAVKYLAYIVPFILVLLAAKIISSGLTKGLKLIALSPINVFFGALFGIIQGVLFSMLIGLFTMITNHLINTPLKELSNNSLLFGYSRDYLDDLLSILAISI